MAALKMVFEFNAKWISDPWLKVAACMHEEPPLAKAHIILSKKFAMKSTASAFTLHVLAEIRKNPAFKSLNIYHSDDTDNGFRLLSPEGEVDCDKVMDLSHPCRGADTCKRPGPVSGSGRPTTGSCWRYSYEWHIKQVCEKNCLLLQMVELVAGRLQLGLGQAIEEEMAIKADIRILRIEQPDIAETMGAREFAEKLALRYEAGKWDDGFDSITKALQELKAQGVIQQDEDVNKCDANCFTPICIAAEKGHNNVVQLLVKGSAEVNKANNDGATPIFMAAQEGHADIVIALVKANANVDIPQRDGNVPVKMAGQSGHAAMVELVVSARADVNQEDDRGNAALVTSAGYGHAEVVLALIAAKSNINVANKEGVTPVWQASSLGHGAVVDVLVPARADVDRRNLAGAAPIFMAAQAGYANIVTALIKAKADVETSLDTGATPLLAAAREGQVSALQQLLAAKSNVDRAMDNGATPISMAAENGYADVVSALAKAKANVDFPMHDGVSPAIIASARGHEAFVSTLLIAAKANEAKYQPRYFLGAIESGKLRLGLRPYMA